MAYLYTIARNLCIDYYRKPQRTVAGEDFSQGGWQKNVENMWGNSMEHVETSLHLQMAVDKLPAEMQELILLRYVNELSVREICKITGLSRSSEYRLEKEALRRLKKLLM